MGITYTRAELLTKVKEAEIEAAKAKNAQIKANWLKIAERYRHLIEQETKDRSD